jgi:hypothetical protein
MSPVPCYIPPFVNGDGVDYELESRAAAQRWMDATGRQIFTFVDSEPESGVMVRYLSPENLPNNVALTRRTNGPDNHPLLDVIEIRNTFRSASTLYLTLLHEFGHTIRLEHFNTSEFIMYGGQPLPSDISQDEIDIVRLHQSLPTRVSMDIYDESNPPFASGSAPRP